MRLGGPITQAYDSPEQWIGHMKAAGYGAALCPVGPEADADTVRAYVQAAQEANIVIAEVGAWSNPLSRDETARRAALEKCKAALALADRIGATCCVNIAGSRGDKWDGPHPDNLTAETFQLIVETVREIIDAVKPTRTYYTLEPMPWIYPDSPDSYLALIRAIERERFAVHLDPVNMINSPLRAFRQASFLQECFTKLGKYIKSVHAKDIVLRDTLTVHLDEVRPGQGLLDYALFLREVEKLGAEMPVIIEHLPDAEYPLAAQHIRDVAKAEGITIIGS